MLSWLVILLYLFRVIEANKLSIYLIQAKCTVEQILPQNVENRDLSNKATFPYSSLGAGLFCMLLYQFTWPFKLCMHFLQYFLQWGLRFQGSSPTV